MKQWEQSQSGVSAGRNARRYRNVLTPTSHSRGRALHRCAHAAQLSCLQDQCPPIDFATVNAIVNKELVANKLVTKVAQVPVVSVPVDPDFAGKGNSTRRSIAIRTFLTADFMTGVPVVRKCYPAGSCVDTREDPDGWCGIGWCGTARQWQSARVVSKQ